MAFRGENMKDRTIGFLTVYRLNPTAPVTSWLCHCACGNVVSVQASKLRQQGRKLPTQSCGCKTSELVSAATRTHGMADTSEYRIWQGMKRRCSDPTVKEYPNYGGRGITVCERWLESFENFYADMGPRPTIEGHSRVSLDRIDNDKGYSPENCRWATQKEQTNNTRRNYWITYHDETKTLTTWAKEFGVYHPTLAKRIKRLGVDGAFAVSRESRVAAA